MSSVSFADPSTSTMENIIELHNFILGFMIIISILVLWLLLQIVDNFIFRFKEQIINKLDKILVFILVQRVYKTRFFKSSPFLEAGWTLIPIYILIAIAGPSFFYLYLSEETLYTLLTIKAIGYQWYWTYDYTDLFPSWYNIKTGLLDRDDYIIESYLLSTDYLNLLKGDFRLLSTDDILIIPIDLHVRLIVTSLDVLHSFSLPSAGIKVDAVPGRLNKVDIFLYRMGVFHGQCSEICGRGHAFMPINLFSISFLNLLIGPILLNK